MHHGRFMGLGKLIRNQTHVACCRVPSSSGLEVPRGAVIAFLNVRLFGHPRGRAEVLEAGEDGLVAELLLNT